jgi:ATP-binding cassette, subfamily B, bacterial CvaB/MchF/RaxB
MARALYKRPRFLLLDEASSHLDDGVEMELNEALLANGATRLMIAHRQQTIELADRCIVLGLDEKLGCSTVLGMHPPNPS